MKRFIYLIYIFLIIALVGCKKIEEEPEPLAEKEKLIDFLETIDYDCTENYCRLSKEEQIFLTGENYIMHEFSYFNLKYGYIEESSIISLDIVDNGVTPIPSVTWSVQYHLKGETYKVEYDFNERVGDIVNTISSGTFGNVPNSGVHHLFTDEYYEINPSLDVDHLELNADQKYNDLLSKWEQYYELADINVELLITEFDTLNE